MIGQVVSHFKIVERLGEGGMAEVYLANDLKLGRSVALKFLHTSRRRDEQAREQLMQEARAASRLDHRNICTIYEVAETETGDLFIAMAYYPGETLRHRISRGPLAVKEALDITIQVAAGLQEAHRNGVVHRDIKPSNILLPTTGELKILDFGIAQLNEPGLVSSSSHYGTITYMAPERIRRDHSDHRSDIWSLGVVLYKMLCGVPPFEGVSVPNLMDTILRSEPRPLQLARGERPRGLAVVLSNALAKDPRRRYQNVGEMAQDLRMVIRLLEQASNELETRRVAPWSPAAEASPVPPSELSMAVLPFEDLSESQDQRYFCLGMAEELIHLLARVEGLRVTSRQSALRLGEPEDLKEVGRKLRVRYVLVGSVRKSGQRLRVTVKLYGVAEEGFLWAHTYDRQLSDVVDLQEEIARAIAAALEVTLIGSPETWRADSGGQSLEAHNLYLKGRYHWNLREESAIVTGIEFFRQAIAEEPRYARAYAGLADSYAMLGIYGSRRPQEAMPQASEAAEKALTLDSSLAEVYVSRALVRSHFDWDFDRAEADFRQALECDSWYATAHQQYAMACLIPQARFDDAFEQLRRARGLDPLSLPIHTSLGLAFYFSRQFEASAAEFDRVLEVGDAFVRIHMFLGQVYEALGDLDAALVQMLTAVDRAAGAPAVTSSLGRIYALLGHHDHARSLLDRLQAMGRKRYVSPVLLSQVHLALGQHDLALLSLEEAWRERASDLIWLGVHPLFDAVRKEPGFHSLLQKIGLPRMPPTPTA